MGLAVSQVRLLALTNRKADIELEMQIDTKRKMQLTRKSTELAQTYYSRLQAANVQYASDNGYQDVTYDYLMGQRERTDEMYADDFLQEIAIGGTAFEKKTENRMILTDYLGQVVVGAEIAEIAAQAKADYGHQDVAHQTLEGLLDFIFLNRTSCEALNNLAQCYADGSRGGTEQSLTARERLVNQLIPILKNGGYNDGGIVYTSGGKYYKSLEGAKNGTADQLISLVPGTCYQVNSTTNSIVTSGLWTGRASGFSTAINSQQAKYFGNLISYFAPIISAAIQNGTTTSVKEGDSLNKIYDMSYSGSGNVTIKLPQNVTGGLNTVYDISGNVLSFDPNNYTASQILAKLNSINPVQDTGSGSWLKSATYYITLPAADGRTHYFKITREGNETHASIKAVEITKSSAQAKYVADPETKTVYNNALDTELLQDGLRSGFYQLAMVDPATGIEKKNTTLTYFSHMNYVSEKLSTEMREKITAWFNVEQQKISEKETYWDSEITNLSTELTSVNTEIESVKTLKSNNIKSVFNWGGT